MIRFLLSLFLLSSAAFARPETQCFYGHFAEGEDFVIINKDHTCEMRVTFKSEWHGPVVKHFKGTWAFSENTEEFILTTDKKKVYVFTIGVGADTPDGMSGKDAEKLFSSPCNEQVSYLQFCPWNWSSKKGECIYMNKVNWKYTNWKSKEKK